MNVMHLYADSLMRIFGGFVTLCLCQLKAASVEQYDVSAYLAVLSAITSLTELRAT